MSGARPVENKNAFACEPGLFFFTRQYSATPANENQMFRIVVPQKQKPAVRKNASADTPSGLAPGRQ